MFSRSSYIVSGIAIALLIASGALAYTSVKSQLSSELVTDTSLLGN